MYGTILGIKFADRLKSGMSTASADIGQHVHSQVFVTARLRMDRVQNGGGGADGFMAFISGGLADRKGSPVCKRPRTWHGPSRLPG